MAKIRTGGIAGDQLRSVIERIERLEQEKAALATDIRDVFAEAKGNGFCVIDSSVAKGTIGRLPS